MPKNKGKYRSQEPADAAPVQQFQSLTARAVQFLRPHWVKLGAVLGGVALVLIGFGVYSWYDGKREAEATKLFGEAVKVLESRVEEEPEAPLDPAKAPEEKKDRTYASAKERNEAALAVLDTLEKEYGSADVAAQARLIRAGVLLDLARYDEAVTAYEKYLGKGDGHLSFVAREGLGYALEAKARAEKDKAAQDAGLQQALQAFEKLQPDEKGFYRDVALFHQARLKAELGDKEGARALYQQILDKWPDSALEPDVKSRVALLDTQG